jgi:hypothetical protein
MRTRRKMKASSTTVVALIGLHTMLGGCAAKTTDSDLQDIARRVHRDYTLLCSQCVSNAQLVWIVSIRTQAARKNGFADWDDFERRILDKIVGLDAWMEARDWFEEEECEVQWDREDFASEAITRSEFVVLLRGGRVTVSNDREGTDEGGLSEDDLGRMLIGPLPPRIRYGQSGLEMQYIGERTDQDRAGRPRTFSFYIASTETTETQWQTVMGFLPGSPSPKGGAFPVAGVSWVGAMDFCRRSVCICHVRRNGARHASPPMRHSTGSSLSIMHGFRRIRRERGIKSVRNSRMRTGCSISSGTWLNGVWTSRANRACSTRRSS